MNKFIAFFSMLSFIVSCGGATDNSTYQSFASSYPTLADRPPAPEVVPEAKRSHVLFDDFSSVDNKGSGWGFVKKKGTEPEIYKSTQELFSAYNTYYVDPERTRTIYLTFDEGYENGYTASILDTLKQYNVKAAFFITGPYLEKEGELVDRMIHEGHIVGNHTVHHPNLHKLAEPQKIADELGELNDSFFEKYGENMKYMRPPEGEYSQRVLSVANSLGYKTIMWSFAYKDWDSKQQKGADYAFKQVTPYLHNGAILLLHAVSRDNAEALGRIIEFAQSEGYTFGTLDSLNY